MSARLRQQAAALHDQARAIQVTEKSEDGLVSATVGVQGDLLRLDIDPRIYRHPDARELADTITDTVHRAAAAAQEKVIELFEPFFPSEVMKAQLEGDLDEALRQMAAQMRGER
jgi:DNA-binding protein YbaB